MFDALLDQRLKADFFATRKRPEGKQAQALKDYILSDALAADIERLRKGDYYLSLPHLKEIPKDTTGEKRQIYTFRGKDQILLCYMGFALLRMYDGLFSDGLYSFRLNRNTRDQIEMIHSQLSDCEEHPYFAFKTDIKGYATNIDQEILIRKLSGIFSHDPEFLDFLAC